MEICKETFLRMSEEVRKELMSCPGAFKAWFACVLEGITAEEMYARASVRDMYGINRHTLFNRKDLINRAHDEYYLMSAFDQYDI